MTNSHRLLAAYAHPDDEAFGTAGVLARSAAAGVTVRLVCATRGEEGEIADPNLAEPTTLAAVREEELRCSCRQLGIGEPLFLDYRDSGMAGAPANQNPSAFCNADREEVVGRLVRIIRELRPQVVLTFDPSGGYGHPDHLAIHRHSLAACQAAAEEGRFPTAGPVWQVSRVFWMTFPRSVIAEMLSQMKAQGVDTSGFEAMAAGEVALPPEEPLAAVVDVAAFADAKWASINCHQTQMDPTGPWRAIPVPVLKQLLRHEYYTLGWPEQSRPRQPWGDLFEGL